jgi:DNA-binding MarR family transcriptional regulator
MQPPVDRHGDERALALHNYFVTCIMSLGVLRKLNRAYTMKNTQKTQHQPCEPERDLVGFWINLASRTIVRVMDARLRPSGFALSHLPVLRALGQSKALPQKDLARIARVEQQTMAEMLARMERDGLVEREPNPEDKRASLTSLTRSARTRFPKAAEILLQGEREAMIGFSDEERALFVDFLKRVVKNLEGLGPA